MAAPMSKLMASVSKYFGFMSKLLALCRNFVSKIMKQFSIPVRFVSKHVWFYVETFGSYVETYDKM